MSDHKTCQTRTDHKSRSKAPIGRPFALTISLAPILSAALVMGCSILDAKLDKAKQTPLKNLVAAEPPDKSDKVENAIARGKNKTRFDGGLLLGDTDSVAWRPDELAKLLDELLTEEKWKSASRLISLYPDVVGKILLGENGSTVSVIRQRQIAKTVRSKVDRQPERRMAGPGAACQSK